MKFYVDAQLPLALSDLIKSKGHNSVHTLELDQKNRTTDTAIIELAEIENRVIITKDYDFLQSQILTHKPKKLILIKTGNINNKNLLQIIENSFIQIVHHLQNYSLIEIHVDEIIMR